MTVASNIRLIKVGGLLYGYMVGAVRFEPKVSCSQGNRPNCNHAVNRGLTVLLFRIMIGKEIE